MKIFFHLGISLKLANNYLTDKTVRRCSTKKGVIKKLCKIHEKSPVAEFLLNRKSGTDNFAKILTIENLGTTAPTSYKQKS